MSTLVCTCRNSGKPYLLDGVSVISHDPGCKVHAKVPPSTYQPVSAENTVGDWKERSDCPITIAGELENDTRHAPYPPTRIGS